MDTDSGSHDPEATGEIDPSELLDRLNPTDEVVLFTDDPFTPALIESLTPESSLDAWITHTESGVELVLGGSGRLATWVDPTGWVLDDAKYPTRGVEIDPTEPTPLNLAYSLLSLGWRIKACAELDRITITALPPKSWHSALTDLAWEVYGLAPSAPVKIALLRDRCGRFALDEATSGVKSLDGTAALIDFHALIGLALAIAPAQLVPEVVAAEPQWHADGCGTPPTSLPADPYGPVGHLDEDDIIDRKERLARWLSAHGMNGPFATRTEVSDFIGGRSQIGHYVLEFTDGSCYIGETVNFRECFLAHLKTYPGEIEAFHVRYDVIAAALPNRSKARKQQLLRVERELIHDAQAEYLVARNFREMANPLQPSTEFAALFSGGQAEEEIAAWFAHPDAANAGDRTALKSFRRSDFGGARNKFDHFLHLTEADQIIRIIQAYLSRCVPFPALTEYRSWSISCLPSAKRGVSGAKYSVLACLSISRTESLTILREDWSGRVIGFVQANEIEAQLASGFGLVRLLRHHPQVSTSPANYSEFGPGTITLHAESFDALERLLDDTRMTRAAATSALRLCRLGPSTQRSAHNPYLAERALARLRDWV